MKSSLLVTITVLFTITIGAFIIDTSTGGTLRSRINEKLWSLEFKIDGKPYSTEELLYLVDNEYRGSKNSFKVEFPTVYNIIIENK